MKRTIIIININIEDIESLPTIAHPGAVGKVICTIEKAEKGLGNFKMRYFPNSHNIRNSLRNVSIFQEKSPPYLQQQTMQEEMKKKIRSSLDSLFNFYGGQFIRKIIQINLSNMNIYQEIQKKILLK